MTETVKLTETAALKHKKRIAMYVIYDPDGKLDSYRKYYLQELRRFVDRIVASLKRPLQFCKQICRRCADLLTEL